MDTFRDDTNFVSVRLGYFARFSKSGSENYQRYVQSKDCVILSRGGLDIQGVELPFEIRFYERSDGAPVWENRPDKIGSFVTTDERYINLVSVFVRREVFADIWDAASSINGSFKNVLIEVAPPSTIVSVVYSEDFPNDTGTVLSKSPERQLVRPRVHPVVVELRTWAAGLASISKGLYVIVAVWAAFSIGSQIITWLQNLTHK